MADGQFIGRRDDSKGIGRQDRSRSAVVIFCRLCNQINMCTTSIFSHIQLNFYSYPQSNIASITVILPSQMNVGDSIGSEWVGDSVGSE